jgi:hypothetical protein
LVSPLRKFLPLRKVFLFLFTPAGSQKLVVGGGWGKKIHFLEYIFVFSIPALSVAYGNIIEHKMRKNISISEIFPIFELIAALFREPRETESKMQK